MNTIDVVQLSPSPTGMLTIQRCCTTTCLHPTGLIPKEVTGSIPSQWKECPSSFCIRTVKKLSRGSVMMRMLKACPSKEIDFVGKQHKRVFLGHFVHVTSLLVMLVGSFHLLEFLSPLVIDSLSAISRLWRIAGDSVGHVHAVAFPTTFPCSGFHVDWPVACTRVPSHCGWLTLPSSRPNDGVLYLSVLCLCVVATTRRVCCSFHPSTGCLRQFIWSCVGAFSRHLLWYKRAPSHATA